MAQADVHRIQVLSTMPHSSIAKAASVVGIGRRNVVSIAADTDDTLQIDLARLETEARRPGVVNILAISCGEVNTGRFATDSLETMIKLREICDRYEVWIHVDGAFGLFGRVLDDDDGGGDYTDIIRGVQGVELADSITADCHKLLNVPYDCGVFFTRHKDMSQAVFSNGNAAYLTSSVGPDGDAIQSPLNIGLENSRRFRALPVYCTLTAYGRRGYCDMLTRQIGLARRVTEYLLKHPKFEVLPAGKDILSKTFMVVLFRARDDELNRNLVQKVNATGRVYLTGTVWKGAPAARMAVSNWQVDVERDARLVQDVLDQVVTAG
jgi:glutamate/tyrosine decarboxylase-like PLP-dependent enzyme